MPKRAVDALSDFRIFETDEFHQKLSKLPLVNSRFVQRKLADYIYPQLRDNPFLGLNIKKLRGYDPATWRYRIGRYRVFFVVDQAEHVVFILSVDDRRDAYK